MVYHAINCAVLTRPERSNPPWYVHPGFQRVCNFYFQSVVLFRPKGSPRGNVLDLSLTKRARLGQLSDARLLRRATRLAHNIR